MTQRVPQKEYVRYGTKRTARTSENIDSVEEFVVSQEDSPASEIHRIIRYFMHKMTLL